MAPEALIHAGGRRGYDELVDAAYSKHFSKAAMTQMSSSSARPMLKRHPGLPEIRQAQLAEVRRVCSETFNPHLKECEHRFDKRQKNLALTSCLFDNPARGRKVACCRAVV